MIRTGSEAFVVIAYSYRTEVRVAKKPAHGGRVLVLGSPIAMMNLVAVTRPLGVLAVLFATLLVAALAQAQTDEQRASARALATEGAVAFNEGRYKESADLFARAESLLHAPPHLLFLARSYNKTGQVVKARETYMKIVKEPLASRAPQAFRDAQAAAQDELRAVEPRIAKLMIRVVGAEDVKDLSVRVDGTPIPSVMMGIPQPVDPGQHKITAVATGKRAQPQSVALRDGERVDLTLTLEAEFDAKASPVPAAAGPPAALPAEVPPVVGAAAPVSAPASGTPNRDSGVSSGSSGMKVASYAALGVGAVGLGVGTVFVLGAKRKFDESDELYDQCPVMNGQHFCGGQQARIEDLDSEGVRARTLGIVGVAVGGVGLATGIALLVLSGGSSASASASASHWVPVVGANYAGVAATF